MEVVQFFATEYVASFIDIKQKHVRFPCRYFQTNFNVLALQAETDN